MKIRWLTTTFDNMPLYINNRRKTIKSINVVV